MNIAVISNNTTEYCYKGCSIAYFSSHEKAGPAVWGNYDAAFLIEPFDKIAFNYWVGHPHLRQLKSFDELGAELDFINRGIEIERKLLICFPDFDKLYKYPCFKADIVQVYLNSENGSHRIRKRVMGSSVSYVETVKTRINGSTSVETERRISEGAYNELLKDADKSKHPIIKKRYCFMYKAQYFELDVYDFWNDRATLELELKREDEAFIMPPEIEVIADVTNDIRYKNNYLAGISYEDYQTELL